MLGAEDEGDLDAERVEDAPRVDQAPVDRRRMREKTDACCAELRTEGGVRGEAIESCSQRFLNALSPPCAGEDTLDAALRGPARPWGGAREGLGRGNGGGRETPRRPEVGEQSAWLCPRCKNPLSLP